MCGCNKDKVILSAPAIKKAVVDTGDCSITLEQIQQTRVSLLAMKTPENTGYINARLGELLTMENSGKYCLYPL